MSTVDPKSFDQFLIDNDIKPTMKTWFALRPALKREFDQHVLKGASPTLLYDWLVEKHEYPLARTSIVRYATTMKAGL